MKDHYKDSAYKYSSAEEDPDERKGSIKTLPLPLEVLKSMLISTKIQG